MVNRPPTSEYAWNGFGWLIALFPFGSVNLYFVWKNFRRRPSTPNRLFLISNLFWVTFFLISAVACFVTTPYAINELGIVFNYYPLWSLTGIVSFIAAGLLTAAIIERLQIKKVATRTLKILHALNIFVRILGMVTSLADDFYNTDITFDIYNASKTFNAFFSIILEGGINILVFKHIKRAMNRVFQLMTNYNAGNQKLRNLARRVLIGLIGSMVSTITSAVLIALTYKLPLFVSIFWPIGGGIHILMETVYQYNLRAFVSAEQECTTPLTNAAPVDKATPHPTPADLEDHVKRT